MEFLFGFLAGIIFTLIAAILAILIGLDTDEEPGADHGWRE